MALHTVSEKKNPLMGRSECWLSLDHSGKPTPKKLEILESVAAHLKAEKEAVVIDKIFSSNGSASSRLKVLVYADKAKVPKEKLDRMRKEKKKKAEGEAAEPKQEEKK